MCDEQTDSYLIHSDVFESSDENSQTTTDLIEFLVQTEKTEELDDDGDWILDRPERIRFILGNVISKQRILISFRIIRRLGHID